MKNKKLGFVKVPRCPDNQFKKVFIQRVCV